MSAGLLLNTSVLIAFYERKVLEMYTASYNISSFRLMNRQQDFK